MARLTSLSLPTAHVCTHIYRQTHTPPQLQYFTQGCPLRQGGSTGAWEHGRSITRTASRKCVPRLLANHLLPAIWQTKEAIFMITKVSPRSNHPWPYLWLNGQPLMWPGLVSILLFTPGPRLKHTFWHEPDNVPDAVTGAERGWGACGCLWGSENTITGNQESFSNSILKSPFHHRSTCTVCTPSFQWFFFIERRLWSWVLPSFPGSTWQVLPSV